MLANSIFFNMISPPFLQDVHVEPEPEEFLVVSSFDLMFFFFCIFGNNSAKNIENSVRVVSESIYGKFIKQTKTNPQYGLKCLQN